MPFEWKDLKDGEDYVTAEPINRIAHQLVASETSAKKTEERITNLENAITHEPYATDESVAYIKNVPANALSSAELSAEISIIGGMTRKCTNLLSYPYVNTTKTQNGVTFTDNGDGSITVNGTATSDTYYLLNEVMYEANKTYTLHGCPIGGGVYTYRLYDDAIKLIDLGNGASISLSENKQGKIYIYIGNGVTATNLVFKPMLNEGSTALPYEPYFEGLRSAPVTEVESVGANFLPYPYAETTKRSHGITFTDNGDGSISVVGTATSDVQFVFAANFVPSNLGLTGGDVVSISGHNMVLVYDATAGINYQNRSFVIEDDHLYRIRAWIGEGQTINTTIYPMLNKGSTALPYAPYVKHTLPIPEAVRNLDGYGEGNPDNAEEYNAIICKDGKWKYSHKGDIDNNVWTPLATPEITDISDILTDNEIAVENGGTLTFKNEYEYAVPSDVGYYVGVEGAIIPDSNAGSGNSGGMLWLGSFNISSLSNDADVTNKISYKPKLSDVYYNAPQPMAISTTDDGSGAGENRVYYYNSMSWDYINLSLTMYFIATTTSEETSKLTLTYTYTSESSAPTQITASIS